MLIQILQSKGQLLTSGARPVAGGLGRVERSLKLGHSVPNRDAYGGCGGRQPPRYGSLLPPIYTPCKPPARVDRIIRVTHGVF
jgi:hypothetical protein